MNKSDYVIERTLQEAEHIINTRCTIRDCAKRFGVGKSTIHKDLTKRLPKINKNMHYRVYLILRDNFNEKHIRGGVSTKRRFERNDKCLN